MPGSMSMSDHLQIIGRRKMSLKSVPVIWTENWDHSAILLSKPNPNAIQLISTQRPCPNVLN